LKDHMKQAGTVEFARILTFDGTDWGRSRGIAYIRYATEAEANNAVLTLDKTELHGRPITVDEWTGGKPRAAPKGFGKGMLPCKGGKGGFMPHGEESAFAMFPGSIADCSAFGGRGWGWKGGKSVKIHGDAEQMVYVGNLPFKAEWQEVKDHMKQAGTVEFVKILTEDGTDFGRSKGIGCIRYSSQAEAEQAVTTLNGTLLMGRKIAVDRWTWRTPPSS